MNRRTLLTGVAAMAAFFDVTKPVNSPLAAPAIQRHPLHRRGRRVHKLLQTRPRTARPGTPASLTVVQPSTIYESAYDQSFAITDTFTNPRGTSTPTPSTCVPDWGLNANTGYGATGAPLCVFAVSSVMTWPNAENGGDPVLPCGGNANFPLGCYVDQTSSLVWGLKAFQATTVDPGFLALGNGVDPMQTWGRAIKGSESTDFGIGLLKENDYTEVVGSPNPSWSQGAAPLSPPFWDTDGGSAKTGVLNGAWDGRYWAVTKDGKTTTNLYFNGVWGFDAPQGLALRSGTVAHTDMTAAPILNNAPEFVGNQGGQMCGGVVTYAGTKYGLAGLLEVTNDGSGRAYGPTGSTILVRGGSLTNAISLFTAQQSASDTVYNTGRCNATTDASYNYFAFSPRVGQSPSNTFGLVKMTPGKQFVYSVTVQIPTINPQNGGVFRPDTTCMRPLAAGWLVPGLDGQWFAILNPDCTQMLLVAGRGIGGVGFCQSLKWNQAWLNASRPYGTVTVQPAPNANWQNLQTFDFYWCVAEVQPSSTPNWSVTFRAFY